MFDIRASVFEDGELNEKKAQTFRDQLIELFSQSPEGQSVIAAHQELQWTMIFLGYCHEELGIDVVDVEELDIEEIVFGFFPEKAPTLPESAPSIISELTAFWQFLDRAYTLENAAACVKQLKDPDAVKILRDELANPQNYGMTKGAVMGMLADGIDITDKAAVDRYMTNYMRLFEPPPESY